VFVDDFDNCVIRNTKNVGIMWKLRQLKREILVERADIVTWRSRYLKEVQECRDTGHLMFYTHKTWTDSNLTFHSCWQEVEVIDIHTHVNLGNRLMMLHVGGIGGCYAGDCQGQMNAANYEKWGAKNLLLTFHLNQ
jgi:hypothetical protein